MFHEKYLQHIRDNALEWYNPDHKTSNLKETLVSYFGCNISFWQPNSKDEQIYSSHIDTGEAV
jgi:hypothetical protein